MDANEGEAVTIVEVEGKNLKINFEKIEKILKKDNIRDLPVGIVSVTGAFRQGKSFLLNLFLRHWDRMENVETNQEMDKKDGIGCRFYWETADDVVTRGIQMWSKPYIVEIEGKEVAIFLVDTQGNFDMEAELEVKYKIFALSTLMSSVQLYNVSKQIQQDDIANLQAFMTHTEPCKEIKASFQELIFLVRDWQPYRPEKYGSKGGNDYLKKELVMGQLQRCKDAQGRTLNDVFKTVGGFLLPHPGMAVQNCQDSKNLNFAGIEKDFMTQVDCLANEIFSSSGVIKQFVLDERTELVTGIKLYEYLEKIAEYINSDKLPVVKTISEYMVQIECEKASQATIQLFKDRTKEISKSPEKDQFISWEDFNRVIEEAEKESLKEFDRTFGSGSVTHTEYREKTKNELQTIKKTLREVNREKERIIDECEEIKKEAIAMFETSVSKLVRKLEDGYFVATDDNTLERAKLEALKHLKQASGAGPTIHKRFEEELMANLNAIINRHNRTNSANKLVNEDCEKRMKQAKTKFNKHVEEDTKRLDEGYSVENDDIFKTAQLMAIKVFHQGYESGSVIHQRYNRDLTEKLDTAVKDYKSKNAENKRIIQTCQEWSKDAKEHKDGHMKDFLKTLDEGYFKTIDDTDTLLKNAKGIALRYFQQSPEKGSQIHRRHKGGLTTDLETDMQEITLRNGRNKEKYDERENLCEALVREHFERLQKVHGLFGYEKSLSKVHSEILGKLPVNDSEPTALKKLRNEMEEKMDKQHLNRKEKISEKNMTTAINSSKIAGGAATMIAGVLAVDPLTISAGAVSTAWGLYGLVTGKRMV